jgi:hypothetical protein
MSIRAKARWLGGAKKVVPLLAATLAAVAALGLAASAASAASAETFSSTDGITINDGGGVCPLEPVSPGTATPYPSVIPVPDLGSSVTDVNVTVSGLTHSWPDDIGLLLVSPTGQSVILMTDRGGSGFISGIELTFDDAASGPVPDNTALVSESTYRPSQGTPTSDFDCNVPASFPLDAPAGPYGTSLSVFMAPTPRVTGSSTSSTTRDLHEAPSPAGA